VVGSPTSSASDPLNTALALVERLRQAGISIGLDRTQDFVTAAARCEDLYWAGRLTLLSKRSEIPVYDGVFYGLEGPTTLSEIEEDRMAEGVTPEGGESQKTQDDDAERASDLELLRTQPFDALTEDAVERLARILERVRRRPLRRRIRRRESARRGGVDLRRTAQDMQRHGGELVTPRFRAPATRDQSLTFLLDVSGSMASMSRGLLLAAGLFVRSAPRQHTAFTIGTRLTQVTGALSTGNLVNALEAAGESLSDRDAGTRIGESLAELIRAHGHSRVVRGTIAIIYSDGLERGDPEQLRAQMERLSLLARRVIWMNPLRASKTYEPLAQGMQAALPYIDRFATGQDLDSFEQVTAEVLASAGSDAAWTGSRCL